LRMMSRRMRCPGAFYGVRDITDLRTRATPWNLSQVSNAMVVSEVKKMMRAGEQLKVPSVAGKAGG